MKVTVYKFGEDTRGLETAGFTLLVYSIPLHAKAELSLLKVCLFVYFYSNARDVTEEVHYLFMTIIHNSNDGKTGLVTQLTDYSSTNKSLNTVRAAKLIGIILWLSKPSFGKNISETGTNTEGNSGEIPFPML